MHFPWLPLREDFDDALREVKCLPGAAAANRLRELATSRLDLTQTANLDRTFLNALKSHGSLPALDARHLAAADGTTAASALDLLQSCWRKARSTFHCQVIQQTVMPVLPELMGSNEDRMPSSPAAVLSEINRRLPQLAAGESIDLLTLD